MVDDSDTNNENAESDSAGVATPSERAARRRIPGNFPYTSSAGVLRRALSQLPTAERPSVFNADFLNTVLGITGGSSRPIIPIFKATGLLNQSGTPTDLYSQYQTDAGRPLAALQALRNGFAEIFKRNQFAHRADENALLDIIVAVTGLPRTDGVVRAIQNTFQVFQEVARNARDDNARSLEQEEASVVEQVRATEAATSSGLPARLGLAYNINVVLPETTNIEVYNAIFKSLRGNLLT